MNRISLRGKFLATKPVLLQRKYMFPLPQCAVTTCKEVVDMRHNFARGVKAIRKTGAIIRKLVGESQ